MANLPLTHSFTASYTLSYIVTLSTLSTVSSFNLFRQFRQFLSLFVWTIISVLSFFSRVAVSLFKKCNMAVWRFVNIRIFIYISMIYVVCMRPSNCHSVIFQIATQRHLSFSLDGMGRNAVSGNAFRISAYRYGILELDGLGVLGSLDILVVFRNRVQRYEKFFVSASLSAIIVRFSAIFHTVNTSMFAFGLGFLGVLGILVSCP